MPDNEEPMPISSHKSRVVQPVALDRFNHTFLAQWQKGKEKYGTDLMTHNGRNVGNDALQEACDLVAYLVQMWMELEDKDAEIEELKQQLKVALEVANNKE